MKTALKRRIGIACLVGCLGMVMVFLAGAAPKSAGRPGETFEYTTVSTDMKSLSSELNKLGKEGWNVVSTIRDDLVLAQENGKNHIRTAQVTIVAKRQSRSGRTQN